MAHINATSIILLSPTRHLEALSYIATMPYSAGRSITWALAIFSRRAARYEAPHFPSLTFLSKAALLILRL